MTSSAAFSINGRLVDMAAADDATLATPSAHTVSLSTSSMHFAPTAHVSVESAPYSPVAALVNQPSNLATAPTHLSARRTFAGGIVRYYTTPETVVLSASSLLPHKYTWRDPLKVPRSLWSACQQRQWWSERLQLSLFADIAIWKAAAIELLGTLILTFMILVIATGILNHKQDYSYFPTAIAICMIPLIAFLIIATATATGGRQPHHTPTRT